MDLVVNEWLPEYFRPEASQEEKVLLENFLQKFIQNEDRIFVRRPSEFLRKVLRYSNDYASNQKISTLIRSFITLILLNSEKCVFVDDGEFTIEESVTSKLAVGNYSSDTYLFEAASITEDKTIITTDARLAAHMASTRNYKVTLLQEFLRWY